MSKKMILRIVFEIVIISFVSLKLPIIVGVLKPTSIQFFLLIIGLFAMIAFHYYELKLFLHRYINQLNISADYEKESVIKSIEVISEQIKSSISTSERYKKINNTLHLAIDVNNALIKSMDIQIIYDFVLSKAIESIEKCDKGSIMLLNEEGYLEFISLIGFDDSFFDIKIKKEDAFLYKLTDGKLDKAIIVKDVTHFNKQYMTNEEFTQFYKNFPENYRMTLSAPIRYDDVFLGVINLDSSDPSGFTEEDLAIMDLFASQLEVTVKNKNLIDEILYLSRFDKLTGAYNRSYFEEVIENRIETNICKFGCVVMDINDLKEVNDAYGHIEGDNLLKVFSSTIKKNIRISDHFARIGGDEFILIIYELSVEEIRKILLRITDQLKKYKETHNLRYEIKFSYGITMFPDEASTSDELYIKSDEKMYQMKKEFKEKR